MNIYFILCQLIATITFLIMCKLILVAPTSKFFSISLYVYIPFCCLGIAPFSGQLGITTSASGRIYHFAFL